MSWFNRVVWSEGMFLQPQHFQQTDRHLDWLVRSTTAHLRPHGWGICELEINRELLAVGKFAVNRCRGITRDGTPFAIPDEVDHPAPLDLAEGTRNQEVFLAVPVLQPGHPEVAFGDGEETAARFLVHEADLADTAGGAAETARLQLGRLRLRLVLESEEREGMACLGIARIAEVAANGNVTLDERYIPPSLNIAASPQLQGFAKEIQGLLRHRAEALSGRVSESGTKGVAEIADFLLLQAVNRYEPLYAHLGQAGTVHPWELYGLAVATAGELATFTARGRRPPDFPEYHHDDLQTTYHAVVAELRRSLSAVLEQTAIALPLQERKYGIWVSPIADRSLLASASFVLAVKADVPAETLRQGFPQHVKIAPVEQIRELITVALPGIRLRPLPVAPRQIPYHAGMVYFELERSGQYWSKMQSSGGFAIHISGEFPGVAMDFWAIRQ